MPSGLIQNLYIYIYSLEPRWYHPVLDVNMFYTLTASKHLSLVPSFLTPECMSTWLLSISLWPPRRYLKIILPTLNSLSFFPQTCSFCGLLLVNTWQCHSSSCWKLFLTLFVPPIPSSSTDPIGVTFKTYPESHFFSLLYLLSLCSKSLAVSFHLCFCSSLLTALPASLLASLESTFAVSSFYICASSSSRYRYGLPSHSLGLRSNVPQQGSLHWPISTLGLPVSLLWFIFHHNTYY